MLALIALKLVIVWPLKGVKPQKNVLTVMLALLYVLMFATLLDEKRPEAFAVQVNMNYALNIVIPAPKNVKKLIMLLQKIVLLPPKNVQKLVVNAKQNVKRMRKKRKLGNKKESIFLKVIYFIL
jgi:hypothetical protein